MLAFNFTEHPLVLLTLEKTKIKYFCHKTSYWHNSKNSLNKKYLPFLRQQYSIVIQPKQYIFISKEKHLSNICFQTCLLFIILIYIGCCLQNFQGNNFKFFFFSHCIVNTAFLVFQKYSTIEMLEPASAPNEVNGKTSTDFIKSQVRPQICSF